ncbi:MAG: hypothetical protein ACLP01_24340 [Solirubrobacteraceae bacterium]
MRLFKTNFLVVAAASLSLVSAGYAASSGTTVGTSRPSTTPPVVHHNPTPKPRPKPKPKPKPKPPTHRQGGNGSGVTPFVTPKSGSSGTGKGKVTGKHHVTKKQPVSTKHQVTKKQPVSTKHHSATKGKPSKS